MAEQSHVRLSIIIPCYNVEDYIERCISSIYASDLDNSDFEIICVDDCSTDSTWDILSDLKREHTNFHSFHHLNNCRQGGARNTGIHLAQGKFIWFVDADDEIFHTGVKRALDIALEKNLDVLCFNYQRINQNSVPLSEYRVYSDTDVMDGYSFVRQVFGKNIINYIGYTVLFFYRTSYIRSIKLYFPVKVCWEDTVYMPKGIFSANRISSISNILYSYRINPNSDTSTFVKSYPARLIFDWVFPTGKDLLTFAESLEDKEYQQVLHDYGIKKHYNALALQLFRTTKNERRAFYKIIQEEKEELKASMHYFSTLNRLLVTPLIGPLVADAGSFFYKTTHHK